MKHMQVRQPAWKKLNKLEGFLYLLPFLIPYILFTFVMLIEGFGLSFCDYKIFGGATFVPRPGILDIAKKYFALCAVVHSPFRFCGFFYGAFAGISLSSA